MAKTDKTAMLRITQIKSGSGFAADQKATLPALGLKRMKDTACRRTTPWIRGMVFKIKHL